MARFEKGVCYFSGEDLNKYAVGCRRALVVPTSGARRGHRVYNVGHYKHRCIV